MRFYPGHTVGQVLSMPAITVLTLLNEGFKMNVWQMRNDISIAQLPHMEGEQQSQFLQSMVLPDDILSDILTGEQAADPTEVAAMKDILNE